MTTQEFGEKLQALPRQWLYLILIIVCTVPLFISITIPNMPDPPSIAFYDQLMQIPSGSTILLSSDWTNSTRGESKSEFDAIVRVLMRKNIKFVVYSIADPQAPQVAKDEIAELNRLRVLHHEAPFLEWTDWVSAGYFPNGDGTAEAMIGSLKKAFQGKTDINLNGKPTDIFQSPVLKAITSIKQIPALIDVTASSTTTTYVQKLNHVVKLLFAVTGVMGPEALPYFTAGQSKGVTIGIKGAYDLETMMQYGVNEPDPNGKIMVPTPLVGKVPGFPGQTNFAQGSKYYPALNAALGVLILAVITGNVGTYLSKSGKKH